MSHEKQTAAGIQFGPYLLCQRLGLGGMASVWKASDETGRTLVVKRILPQLAEDPEFVEMFVSEARLSARMRHPNIVRIFEHGDYEGERFLAMEYLHGRDLGSVMQLVVAKEVTPTPALGAFIAREVGRALVFVHALKDLDTGAQLNLIHRDVSLSNVMLGFDGSVKLLDFGVAKSLASGRSQRTEAGVLKGKWAYLAPEQVEAVKIDQRSDIFSLGVVLHEVLTARRLFKAPTSLGTLERVRAARVLPPSTLNPAVPPELDAICLKALARAPSDRFQTAAEMVSALDEVVARLGFQGPELAVMLTQLLPRDAAFAPASRLTPRRLETVYDDGDTDLSSMDHVAEASTRPVPRLRRSLWRVMLAVLLVSLAGGLTGWQLARAEVTVPPSYQATPARPAVQGQRLSPETHPPSVAPAPANPVRVQGG
jgi:serine/threonine protein kinase